MLDLKAKTTKNATVTEAELFEHFLEIPITKKMSRRSKRTYTVMPDELIGDDGYEFLADFTLLAMERITDPENGTPSSVMFQLACECMTYGQELAKLSQNFGELMEAQRETFEEDEKNDRYRVPLIASGEMREVAA